MNIYEWAELHGENVAALRAEGTEDTRCRDCDYEFDCGMIRATRYQPAEARVTECPNCGSSDLEAA